MNQEELKSTENSKKARKEKKTKEKKEKNIRLLSETEKALEDIKNI